MSVLLSGFTNSQPEFPHTHQALVEELSRPSDPEF
jgi:hypothetical protein